MRSLLSLLILCCLSSCTSSKPYSEQRVRMDKALTDIQSNNPQQADARLGRLLLETEQESSDFALQRFHAASLLTLIHAEAALGEGYLQENKTAGLFDTAGLQVSGTAHLVATCFYAAHVQLWAEAASKSKSVIDDERLLPADLSDTTVANTGKRTSYLVIYALTRLRFEERLASLLKDEAALTDFDFVVADMEQLGVPEGARPWVMLSLFHLLERTDKELAFKFGLTAFQLGRESIGAQDMLRYRALGEWLLNPEEGLHFVCPSGNGGTLDPNSPICGGCLERPAIDFQLRRKEGN